MTISWRRGSARLNPRQPQDRPDGFLLRRAMKPQVLTMRTSASSGARHDDRAGDGQLAEDALGIHQVLRAAERDEVNPGAGFHVAWSLCYAAKSRSAIIP